LSVVRSKWSISEWACLLFALALLLSWDASGLDLWVSHFFADSSGFAERNGFVSKTLLHTGGKATYFVCFGLLLWNYFRPMVKVPKPAQLWWFGTMLICIAVISLLKYLSKSSCPWSLQIFGGVATHMSHWNFFSPDGGPGRCFPSGHLSGAFSLLAVHFALRPISRVWSRNALFLVLLLGLLFGLGQVMRGAHFVSHVLYSGWLSWLVCLLSQALRDKLAPKAGPI
jgi:membrane-associated PAP2 superfamily phosphatase